MGSLNSFGYVSSFSISLSCSPSTGCALFLLVLSLWCLFEYLLMHSVKLI